MSTATVTQHEQTIKHLVGLLMQFTGPDTSLPERQAAPESLEPLPALHTPRLIICFDIRRKRALFTVKRSKQTVVKHYRTSHGLRIMYGRMRRDPDGFYTRQCAAQAHWCMLRPTATNYPI